MTGTRFLAITLSGDEDKFGQIKFRQDKLRTN